MSKWVQPMKYTGKYPSEWNGYTFLQWSNYAQNFHEGVDYNFGYGSQDKGLKVMACSEGTVEYVGYVPDWKLRIKGDKYWNATWGHHVFVRHKHPKYGIIYSHYAHLQNVKVKVGDRVATGQQIGECSNSGNPKMSPHLHFEIRRPMYRGYNFYPTLKTGWTREKMREFYFDPYLFIETENTK